MRVRKAWLLFIAVLLVVRPALGDGPFQPEEVKAAFIVNFAKFTRWPEHAAEDFAVCFPTVAEAVGAFMEREYVEVQIQDRLLEIRRGVDLDELRHCRIVYLGMHDAYRRSEILGELLDTPVLTVSDQAGFNTAGGMIELFREGNKYRFAVNLKVVTSESLEINARVLGLARKREKAQ